jgi:solute carrier family 25 phosphate transporter 23/24/25/41
MTTAATPAAAPAVSRWNRRQLLQMGAGGSAGIVAKTVVAPFERVKIVCQTGESAGMVRTTRAIWAAEGLVGFWRGNAAACVRVVPHKAVLFGCSDMYKDVFRALNTAAPGELPAWGAFASGSLAGFTASVLTYPLDLIRTRVSGYIGKDAPYSGIYSTFMRTFREEGFRALFRGIGPTLAGSIPYEGIKFGAYDVLTQLLPADIDPKASFAGKIMCGGGAGMLATILTYPNDTVRRRLQMQGSGGTPRIYRHAIHCYVVLAKQEGVASFYRGLTPTLVRAVPNMGVQFATYELFKSMLPK